MPIAYRYKVLFYHENQRWVRKIVPLIDIPPLLLFMTDTASEFEKQLDSKEVDIILTGVNTKHLLLTEDETQSMAFKTAPIWEVVERHGLSCQIILLCSQKEQLIASKLVHSGRISDYCIVNPLLDRDRPYISIMRALENTMFRDVIQQKVLQPGERVPKFLTESVELLQTIRKEPEMQDSNFGSYPNPYDMALPDPDEDKPRMSVQDFLESLHDMPNDDEPLPPPQIPLNDLASPAVESDFPAFPKPDALKTGNMDLLDDEENSVFPSIKNVLEHTAKPGIPFPIQEPIGGNLVKTWARMKKSEYNFLLLEKHPETIQLIQQTLERGGFKVLVATSSEEGLKYLNNELFELLILSRDIPGYNALDFLNQLRVKGPQADIPAIVLSSNASEQQIIKSIKVGANHFLLKPVDPVRLIEIITQVVRENQSNPSTRYD